MSGMLGHIRPFLTEFLTEKSAFVDWISEIEAIDGRARPQATLWDARRTYAWTKNLATRFCGRPNEQGGNAGEKERGTLRREKRLMV